MKDLGEEGWHERHLKEVADVGAGNPAPQDKQLFEDGQYPFIRTSDVGQIRFGEIESASDLLNEKGVVGLRLVPAGTILMPKSGASTFLNHRVITLRDAYVSSHLATITAKRGLAEPRYLLYALSRIAAQELLPENSYPSLNLSLIKSIKLPVPPLEEQQRVVAVLDEAFEGLARARAHTEANLQNARELFESIKAKELAYSGSDSTEVILSDVTDITSGLVDPREDEYADMLHLGAGNMITGTDELVDVKTAREEKLKSGKYLFTEATILYSKIRPYLRKVARPNFQGLCSADVYPLTPKPDRLDRDFLFHLLLGNDFTEYAVSGSGRAGMPKVNRNHMFAYRFDLPPLEAQKRISAAIDEAHISCGALFALANKKLQDLDDLRQSLLQKAFVGELT